jgi:hypothetical protein
MNIFSDFIILQLVQTDCSGPDDPDHDLEVHLMSLF